MLFIPTPICKCYCVQWRRLVLLGTFNRFLKTFLWRPEWELRTLCNEEYVQIKIRAGLEPNKLLLVLYQLITHG